MGQTSLTGPAPCIDCAWRTSACEGYLPCVRQVNWLPVYPMYTRAPCSHSRCFFFSLVSAPSVLRLLCLHVNCWTALKFNRVSHTYHQNVTVGNHSNDGDLKRLARCIKDAKEAGVVPALIAQAEQLHLRIDTEVGARNSQTLLYWGDASN